MITMRYLYTHICLCKTNYIKYEFQTTSDPKNYGAEVVFCFLISLHFFEMYDRIQLRTLGQKVQWV